MKQCILKYKVSMGPPSNLLISNAGRPPIASWLAVDRDLQVHIQQWKLFFPYGQFKRRVC